MGGVPADLGGERGEPVPRILGDVPPLVAVQDRGDQQADRHRDHEKIGIERPRHGVVGPTHHHRTHENKNQGQPQGSVLVLKWRRGIEVAADETDQAEKHDRPAAMQRQEDAHDQGQDEARPGNQECATFTDPALEDGHRHSR